MGKIRGDRMIEACLTGSFYCDYEALLVLSGMFMGCDVLMIVMDDINAKRVKAFFGCMSLVLSGIVLGLATAVGTGEVGMAVVFTAFILFFLGLIAVESTLPSHAIDPRPLTLDPCTTRGKGQAARGKSK
jgi:hypothetical protein